MEDLCLLVLFPNDDNKVCVGYASWIQPNLKSIDEIKNKIKNENIVIIKWPVVNRIEPPNKKMNDISEWETCVAKILDVGKWTDMRCSENNYIKYGQVTMTKTDRKKFFKKPVDLVNSKKDKLVPELKRKQKDCVLAEQMKKPKMADIIQESIEINTDDEGNDKMSEDEDFDINKYLPVNSEHCDLNKFNNKENLPKLDDLDEKTSVNEEKNDDVSHDVEIINKLKEENENLKNEVYRLKVYSKFESRLENLVNIIEHSSEKVIQINQILGQAIDNIDKTKLTNSVDSRSSINRGEDDFMDPVTDSKENVQTTSDPYSNSLKYCSLSNAKTFFNEALSKLFTREIFAISSVTGNTSGAFKDRAAKTQLDRNKMESILDYACKIFIKTSDRQELKSILHSVARTKCNNASRIKKPVDKELTENK